MRRHLDIGGWRRATRSAMLVLAIAVSGAPAATAATPQRIVSFNLCADQLVLALADSSQIAGLSPYAADPKLSVMADAAKAYPRLDWQAESTLPLQPDLVLVGSWDRPVTRRMLAALGQRMAEVPLVTDIEAARREIIDVAALVGHPDRGAGLVAQLDAARKRLQGKVHGAGAGATALVVERGGFTAGTETLAAALLAEAGFRPPPGAPAGYGGFVSLERLLMLKPDVVVLKDPPRVADDQGALYLTHPALRALYPQQRRIELPTRYSFCGGPALVAAMDYLAGQIDKLALR
jgi:iron complex transport system substrate-binding protein